MNVQINCPVIQEANTILTSQQEITRKLHHFKTTLQHCGKCSYDGSCEALNMVNQSIDSAIREVSEEWGI